MFQKIRLAHILEALSNPGTVMHPWHGMQELSTGAPEANPVPDLAMLQEGTVRGGAANRSHNDSSSLEQLGSGGINALNNVCIYTDCNSGFFIRSVYCDTGYELISNDPGYFCFRCKAPYIDECDTGKGFAEIGQCCAGYHCKKC